MYTVKFTPYRERFGAIASRQTPGGSMISPDGRFRFVIDPHLKEADFWVVQGKGVRGSETCRVAPENTVLLTTEPRSVLTYPDDYLRQFGVVVSCQEGTRHKGLRLGPPVLPWFVGFDKSDNGAFAVTLDYDTLANAPAPEKSKLISVITSDKAFTRGHLRRISFVERLKQAYGDRLDVFGHGFNSFGDKWEVLAPYKYHVVIENSSEPFYWTEKIGDCFMAETYPLYYGCTRLEEYFPAGSFTPIDICDFDSAKAAIDRAIATDAYGRATTLLHECKELMLGKYNMFAVMAEICASLDAGAPKREVTIEPCHSMHSWRNVLNYTFARNYYKFLGSLHKPKFE